MSNTLNWDQVVEDLGPRLFRYFCSRFTPEQADDLTQESLIRLVRKVREGAFDPSRGSLNMLAFGIAHFVALESRADWRQRDSNSSVVADEVAATTLSPEEQTVERDLFSKVRGAIQSLSEIEQQIWALILDEELSHLEISEILRIPEGTIKSHVHRGKKTLSELLRDR